MHGVWASNLCKQDLERTEEPIPTRCFGTICYFLFGDILPERSRKFWLPTTSTDALSHLRVVRLLDG